MTNAMPNDFQESLNNLSAKMDAKKEAQETIETDIKASATTAEDDARKEAYELIEKQGGPDAIQIQQWNDLYFNKVFLSNFGEKDIFIYRYLALPEWKDIVSKFQEAKNANEDLIDELIVSRALLYPQYDKSLLTTIGAGTIATLSQQIQFVSNFISPDIALRMIVKI